MERFTLYVAVDINHNIHRALWREIDGKRSGLVLGTAPEDKHRVAYSKTQFPPSAEVGKVMEVAESLAMELKSILHAIE